MLFERLKEGDNSRAVVINKIDLWVQLHGMDPGFMSLRVVMDVGNYIGTFVESNTNNFVGVWRDFLRVRVTIDIDKPLQRRMKLRKSEKQWCWAKFKYEGVPTFCFICGLIGHSEKFCARIFDIPIETIEKSYGSWMRAEPKRRNHTIGTKWLRQGSSFPAEVQAAEGGDVGGDGGAVIAKESDHNSMISGEAVGALKGNGLLAGRVFVENRKDRFVEGANIQETISTKIIEREKEATEIESIGLSFRTQREGAQKKIIILGLKTKVTQWIS